jgi:hypothetical protein
MPKFGHVCTIEAPDEFNAVLRAFLQEHRD